MKTKKKILIIVIIIVIIACLLLLLSIIFKHDKNKFLGTWVSNGGTIYEFKEKNKGVMKTSLSEYKFTYKIKDNVISIDFKKEKAIDTDYEYTFQKNKLIMKSDKGTFTFNKK